MLAVILLVVTSALLVGQVDSAALDRIATEELAKQKIPGISVVVVKGDRVVYAKGFGVASLESRLPVTPDTLFRVGSMTKMFTATAALSLVEQGRLRLDAPVGSYIHGLSPKVGEVTAHQLLSHTAGLLDEAPAYGSHDESALAARVTGWNESIFFTRPGKIFSYSNPGYALLGRLMEVIKGNPYADVMASLVFRPLGMDRATFRPTEAMTSPLAAGHTMDGRVSRPMADNAGAWPAGFLFSSGNDFARFVLAYLNDGKLGEQQIFARSIVDALKKPRVPIPGMNGVQYGYGLYFDATHTVGMVAHSGAIPGFTSDVAMVPEFKTGVILLANRDEANLYSIEQRMLERLLPVGLVPTAFAPPPAAGDASRFTGVYRNGEARIVITVKDGKLTGTRGGTALPLMEAAGGDCFRGTGAAICFTEGYAHLGTRAFSKQ